MKTLLLMVAIAWPAAAQSPKFTDISAIVKGIALGASHCTVWSHLTGAYSVEVACYNSLGKGPIQAAPAGDYLVGSYPAADGGVISWVIKPDGAYTLCARTAAGVAAYKSGTF